MSQNPRSARDGCVLSRMSLELIMTIAVVAFAFLIAINIGDDSSATDSGTCGPSTTWVLDDNHVLTISGTGIMDDLNHPNEQPWGAKRETITSVVIEEGVTSVGNYSFYYFINLTSVTLPHSLTRIGVHGFFQCTSLEGIKLHNGLTEIGGMAFNGCNSLKYLSIPDTVEDLSNGMIENCTDLEMLYFSNNLRQGGSLPGVERICTVGFYNADGTDKLNDQNYDDLRGKVFVLVAGKYVEASVSSNGGGNIGWSFSGGGPSGGQLHIFGTGEMDDYANPDDQPWSQYRQLIDVISIDENVTAVGDYAFYLCGNASFVTFNSPVTSIGADSFSYMNNLEMIALPSGLTSIGDYAFRYSGLKEITIPEGVTATGHGTFMYCNSLASVTIPDPVITIDGEAFLGCINLKEIYFGTGITTIAADAFTDVELYDTDGTSEIAKDADHLKGAMFVNKNDRPVKIAIDLTMSGHVCSLSSETNSASITADDITYLKKRVSMYQDTVLRLTLKDSCGVAFDGMAIYNIGSDAATFTLSSIDKSTLSDAVKELVGDCPVFTADFGSNKDFGNGKVTLTVPYELSGKSAEGMKAYCIKNDAVAETIECTYADGKASFVTNDLSMFYVGFDSSPNSGSNFPIWIPIVAVIAIVAIGAGAYVFVNRKP